ncbi:MAG: hypothetical protein FWE88_01375 [Phycisphaerae bacterium]|nr:hypothetical protein [Phycisphaerae bacterium]
MRHFARPRHITICLAILCAALTAGCKENHTATMHTTAITTTPATAPTSDAAVELTAQTLEPWLGGKEFVEVAFVGLAATEDQLDAWRTWLSEREYDYSMAAGSAYYRYHSGYVHDGSGRNFAYITMKVTPDNVKRLLSLQKDLAERDYTLDTKATHVLSYVGDEATRRKAREMIPDILADIATIFQDKLQATTQIFGKDNNERFGSIHSIRYAVTGEKNFGGGIYFVEIPQSPFNMSAAMPDFTIHLPHLGLLVQAYHLHGAVTEDVKKALQPLIDLDGKPQPFGSTGDGWHPLVSTTTAPAPAATPPTEQTLEQWLVGKEVIRLTFTGQGMAMRELNAWLEENGYRHIDMSVDPTFISFAWQSREVGVDVRMRATPVNVERLLSLRKELAGLGFTLNPYQNDVGVNVLSYVGDEATRQKARDMVPDRLAALEKGLQDALQARIISNRIPPNDKECLGNIRYEVPDTKISGMIHVYEITPSKSWERNVHCDQTIYLPHLGLVVTAYYRPGQVGAGRDTSPQRAAFHDAVQQAMKPLTDLDDQPRLYNHYPVLYRAPSAVHYAYKVGMTSLPPTATPPLEQWLEGKAVVTVTFVSPPTTPKENPEKAYVGPDAEFKKHEVREATFRCSVHLDGRGSSPTDRREDIDQMNSVEVTMDVTPENIERLLTLQKDLREQCCLLDPMQTNVLAYVGDADVREKARNMVPDLIASLTTALQEEFKVTTNPSRKFEEEMLGGIDYGGFGVRGADLTGLHGMIHVHDMSAKKSWALRNVRPNRTIHLPHLRLAVGIYYRPGRSDSYEDESPQRDAFLDAMQKIVQPLIDLDPTPWIYSWPSAVIEIDAARMGPIMTLLATPTTAPTTEPATPATAPAVPAKPTAETLEQWLGDKEFVQIHYESPRVMREKPGVYPTLDPELRKLEVSDQAAAYYCFVTMTNRKGVIFWTYASVIMHVTPDNVKRLLALQEDLKKFDLVLDTTKVNSYVGDAETRRKAREVIPEILAATETIFRDKLQASTIPYESKRQRLGGIRYEIPRQNGGMIEIYELGLGTPGSVWTYGESEMTVHLPRLGLCVMVYCHDTVFDTVKQTLQPLIDLDGEPQPFGRSSDRRRPKETPTATPAPAAIPELTARTLEQWLGDKECVYVTFVGPRVELEKLRIWLKDYRYHDDDRGAGSTFRSSPGEDESAGESRTFVRVQMNVTPDNVKRLLRLQEDLAQPFPLDASETGVLSHIDDKPPVRSDPSDQLQQPPTTTPE